MQNSPCFHNTYYHDDRGTIATQHRFYICLATLMGFALPECKDSAIRCPFYGMVHLLCVNDTGRKSADIIILRKARYISTLMPT